MKFSVGKILGKSTAKSWSQVHIFSPQDADKLAQRGRFLAVLSLRRKGRNGEVVEIGREVITRLHEEYFGRQKEAILPTLKKAVLKVAQEIPEDYRFEVAAAVFSQETVYLVVFGSGRVILKRGSSLGVVCQGKKKELVASSGFLKPGDWLFLGNGRLYQKLAEGILKAALSSDSIQETVEMITPVVYSQKGSQSAVGVIVEVAEEEEERKEAEVEKERDTFQTPEKVKPPAKIKKILFKLVRGVGRVYYWAERKLATRKIYLGRRSALPGRKKSRRRFLIIAVILISGLGLSLVWGVGRKRISQRQEDQRMALAEIEFKLEEGQNLIDLNPIRARQLLEEARNLLNSFETEGELAEQVMSLKQTVTESLMAAEKEYQEQTLTVYFDLEVIKEGARGSHLLFNQGRLVVLDAPNQSLYQIEVSKKQGEILTGGNDWEAASRLALSTDQVFILTKQGIIARNWQGDQEKVVVEADPDWGEIPGFWNYSGNLYLLDQGSQALYRYPVIEGGFGAKQSWVKQEEKALGEAISMAIDGSIWILTKSGEILKFTLGFADPFGIAGLDQEFSNPRQLYTEVDFSNLYVLDGDQNRVVVIGKDGEYQAQYLWTEPGNIKQIVVSEELEKIWLLGESKIYEIEIK